jgi:hypothetical protein
VPENKTRSTFRLRVLAAAGALMITASLIAPISVLAAATQIAANTGNGQTATVGTAVAIPPSVIVRDGSSNPVSGVSVTFAVATGGGSATGTAATTDGSGIATVGSWTLGTVAGTNTLTATAAGLAGSPVTFTATGTPGPATQIAVYSGNGQSAPVGTAVVAPPTVIVKDALNNPVFGVSVTFAVATGGGSATGLAATTNASGLAAVGSWTLGPAVGANTLTATSGILAGSPVTFTATGTAGATQIAVNAGNGQSATVGTAVAIPPSVIVRDGSSNPVSGVSVTFAVASGGGSATGLSATTNGAGIATVGSWTLGTTAGPNTLTATSAGLAGSPVTFTATGTPGAPTRLAFVDQPGGGPVNEVWFGQPAVAIKDALGNTVTTSTTQVTLTITSNPGGGSLDCFANPKTTFGGIAYFDGCSIDSAGFGYRLTATSPPGGPSGATSLPFDITSVDYLAFSGYPASNTPSLLSPQPAVQLRDSRGFLVTAPANQIEVRLTVSPATTAFTCTNGTVRWTSGGTATFSGCTLPAGNSYRLTATPTFRGSGVQPVTGPFFNVGGRKLGFTQQPGGTGAVPGQPLPIQPIVTVQDSAGVIQTSQTFGTVTLTIATGPAGATLACTNGNTRNVTSGYASFSGCAVSLQGTNYSFTATYTPTMAGESSVLPATSLVFSVNSAPTQITLTSSATIVTSGQGFSLAAQFATLGSGKSVNFQRKAASDVDWTTFVTVVADSTGRASTMYTPTYSAQYRATFAGGGGLAAGSSNVVTVNARFSSAVMTPAYRGTMTLARGTAVTYTAVARPLNPAYVTPTITFQIFKWVDNAWVFQTSNTGPSNSNAVRSFTWTWNHPGTWYMRARVNATAYNTARWSNLARVTIP